MSTTLRPAPPRPSRVDPPQDPDALIEEARRRARRRRRWYAASALLAASAAANAFAGYNHGGGGGGHAGIRAAGEGKAAAAHAGTGASAGNAVRNGALTILAGADISTIGARGHLERLFHCDGDKGCNELESVAWSPDGNRFAFGVGSYGEANDSYDGLNIVDRRNGKIRRITKSGHAFDLAWSPDGAKLAFVDGGRIGLINADGTGAQWLRTAGMGLNVSPTWSPDGTRIAYATDLFGHSIIRIVALSRPYNRLLVTDGFHPAWSPRGDRIAYSVRCGIRLVTPLGQDVTPPPPRECEHIGLAGMPSWSPDGLKIALVHPGTHSRTGRRGVYVMDADGGHLRRLTPATPRISAPRSGHRAYAPVSWQPRVKGEE